MSSSVCALNTDFTIACPSFPDAGRTVYFGHMFVNGKPLNESGMENHPLTPMTDHNLVRSMNQFKLIQSFDEVMGEVS